VRKSLRCFNPNVIQSPPWNLEQLRNNWRDPEFPVKELQHFTEHDNQEKREELRNLLSEDTFIPEYNIPLEKERQNTYDRLNKICKNNMISVYDFQTNPHWIFAAHELAAIIDPDMATKMTVQFNLFGGTVLKLGTERHHHILPKIDTFTEVGCFGLTELAYGNNAVEMETTATFDSSTDEFVINTPTVSAQKYWITNGALHAHYCCVFARLINGEVDEGLHVFLVPIRDADLAVKDGVTIHDMGRKMGLNGIDNAKISFSNVRVPRTSLLNAYSDFEADGSYSTSIKGRGKRARFLKVADQLLSGRLCISSMSQGAAKAVLTGTVRYQASRCAVGESGASDTPILSYQLNQDVIAPFIASTYVYEWAMSEIKNRWADQQAWNNPTEDGHFHNVLDCCAIKAITGWHIGKVADQCRERCGGMGYLEANRFGYAIAGSHSSRTAEGDNSVLMNKVASELIQKEAKNATSLVGTQKWTAMTPFTQAKLTNLFKKNQPTIEDLGQLEELMHLYYQCNMAELMLQMKSQVKQVGRVSAWMEYCQGEVQSTARAYGDYTIVRDAIRRVKAFDGNAELGQVMLEMIYLHIADVIMQNSANYVKLGVLGRGSYKSMEKQHRALCKSIGNRSVDLTDAFGLTDNMIATPCALDWIAYNAYDNQGEVVEFMKKL